jgi:hypothetical protein
MKRWFQYQEETGTIQAYTSRLTLVCMMCLPIPMKQYRTTSLRALIQHYRNEHTEDFVSVDAVRIQTTLWRNEWVKRKFYGPYLVNYPMIASARTVVQTRGSTD